MGNLKSIIFIVYSFIFFRIKWVDRDGGSGYYLVRRKWVHILLSPILLSVDLAISIINTVYYYFVNIWSYDYHWIASKKRKLSWKEKVVYYYQLNN